MGRPRSAQTDWTMFGYYIMHNIGIGFQCFAGYLTARGHGENVYSFVVTHSAFKLTAIVLAGAAGLRIGHALLAPRRLTRLEALKQAAGDVIVVVGILAAVALPAYQQYQLKARAAQMP